jgi:alkaline phosphatase D
MLAALDHTFHPYFDPVPDVTFTRIGAVYPDSAKLVVRYPDASVNATQRDVRIIWREVKRKANLSDETGWKNGPVLSLKESEDWVGTVKLRGTWMLL